MRMGWSGLIGLTPKRDKILKKHLTNASKSSRKMEGGDRGLLEGVGLKAQEK